MKKQLLRAASGLLCLMLLLCAVGCDDFDPDDIFDFDFGGGGSSTSDGGDSGKTRTDKIDLGSGAKANVVASETSQMTYDEFNNGLVSLKIPHGWQVEVPPVDYIHYSFKVFNPQNKNYMFLFGLKQEGFLKSKKAHQTFSKLYPDAVFSKLSPIDPQTTEAFYKVWNKNVKYSNQNELKSEYFPYLNKFKVIENLGQVGLGGDVLRATFSSGDEAMQGLFTATVMDAGSYYINTDMFNLTSPKVDVAPLNVYNIILMTAPDADFNNWQPIMDSCIGTITFSDAFIQGFNNEEKVLASTIRANQQIYDQTSDMIMDSWNKRSNAYDITSQKQSDATLGYERVYDTETGDVYRAYNGFTDDYSGERYKAITDDMYTKSIAGYIQK